MTNTYRTTFYIGVTNDLRARIWQHLNNEGSAFVKKYKLFGLVYFEYFEKITDAIARKKQLKNWHHQWKVNLIQAENQTMRDLKEEILKTVYGVPKQVRHDIFDFYFQPLPSRGAKKSGPPFGGPPPYLN